MFELSGPADGYVSFALSLDKWMVIETDTFDIMFFIFFSLIQAIQYISIFFKKNK